MQDFGFLLLCGGHSRRMGKPKGLLPINGETLVERIARAGEGFSEKLFSENGEIPAPAGFCKVRDLYPNCGPMGGLQAALSVCSSQALICAPCDTPFYSAELAQFLAAQYTPEWDAMILQGADGWDHPLMGVYSKSCLPAFTQCVREDKLKLMWTLEELHTKKITLPPQISQKVFLNLNTPQAYTDFLASKGEFFL